VIKAQIEAKGVIEKPDVIGAVFGQTEGLLGSDLDLRELQRTGRIGRIEVNIRSEKGNSSGEIIIPSSLDSAETALIAATMETIERVGPCTAKIILRSVEDTRSLKRKYVIEKAKEILKNLMETGVPSTSEIADEIREAVRTIEITSYHGLPSGPNLTDSDNIIIVEGRADVINLLKYGIRNTIAIEGTSIPQAVVNLSKEKVVTTFFDGDRGGELNLKSLLEVADIDYVALTPPGKEVEELSKKEVYKALRDKTSVEQFRLEHKEFENNTHYHAKKERLPERPPETDSRYRKYPIKKEEAKITDEEKLVFKKTLDDLVGTRAACIFDSKMNLLGKVPVKELINTLETVDNPHAVVFDGKIDFELNDIARKKGIKHLIGMEKDNMPSSVNLISREDFK
jgi:DNA primase